MAVRDPDDFRFDTSTSWTPASHDLAFADFGSPSGRRLHLSRVFRLQRTTGRHRLGHSANHSRVSSSARASASAEPTVRGCKRLRMPGGASLGRGVSSLRCARDDRPVTRERSDEAARLRPSPSRCGIVVPMKTRRIGILTGGGDVPGLNSVIKSVVYRSREAGWEVVGIRKGWEGLTHARPGTDAEPEYARPLTRENTRTIDRTAAPCSTPRPRPSRVRDERLPPHLAGPGRPLPAPTALRPRAWCSTPAELGIDCDRHRATAPSSHLALSREGVPLMASQDDGQRRHGTEYCLGFSRHTRAKISSPSNAHDAGLARAHRRLPHLWPDSGFTAATRLRHLGRFVIPEHLRLDRLAQLILSDKENNPTERLRHRRLGRHWSGRAERRAMAATRRPRHPPDIGEALATSSPPPGQTPGTATSLRPAQRQPHALDNRVHHLRQLALDLSRRHHGRWWRSAASATPPSTSPSATGNRSGRRGLSTTSEVPPSTRQARAPIC